MGSEPESILGLSYFREASDTKWEINTNLRPYREKAADRFHPLWNSLIGLLQSRYLQIESFSEDWLSFRWRPTILGENNVRT